MSHQHAGTLVVLSRKEAAMCGLSRFYTGKTCKLGHYSERFVSNRQCVECNSAEARHRERERGLLDPSYRMFRNTLRRTGAALGGQFSPREAVACDHLQLRDHLAAKFRSGMSWNRYRQWEVDHIVPLSSASSQEQLVQLCHYTNLQPLWRRENRMKGGA